MKSALFCNRFQCTFRPMTFLPTLHLILVCVWAGLVLAETVIELSGRKDEDLLRAARLHFQIDVFAEIPVVLGVLMTGLLLTMRMWPPSNILWIKIGLGFAAIAVNLYCAVLVIARYRKRSDPESLRRLSRNILQTWLGIPLGLAAFYLGFRGMGLLA